MVSVVGAGSEAAGLVVSEEQAQLADAQQVLVTLEGGHAGKSSAEVLEVNMYELLNNSVTFICEGRPSEP